MKTYNIDDDIAYNDFIQYLREEKPEKTFKGDIIELPDFSVKVFPEYKDKIDSLFNEEFNSTQNKRFDTKDLVTEVVENQGYKFLTFKG